MGRSLARSLILFLLLISFSHKAAGELSGEIPLWYRNFFWGQDKGPDLYDESFAFLDTDHDQIPDRYDPDIDGDGIHNLLDPRPFRPDRFDEIEDQDRDGVADFVDLSQKNLEWGKFQEELFIASGIVLIFNDFVADSELLKLLKKSIFRLRGHWGFIETKVLVLLPERSRTLNYYGEYDGDWKSIFLYPANGRLDLLEVVIAHEFGHSFKMNSLEEIKKLFAQNNSIDFPSAQAKKNVEEFLAEVVAFRLLSDQCENDYSYERYFRYNSNFKKSRAFELIELALPQFNGAHKNCER